MRQSDDSSLAKGAAYLIAIGLIGAALGVFFIATGFINVANGAGVSSAGGLPQVIFGALFGATAFLLGMRGLRVHREIRNVESTDS